MKTLTIARIFKCLDCLELANDKKYNGAERPLDSNITRITYMSEDIIIVVSPQ